MFTPALNASITPSMKQNRNSATDMPKIVSRERNGLRRRLENSRCMAEIYSNDLKIDIRGCTLLLSRAKTQRRKERQLQRIGSGPKAVLCSVADHQPHLFVLLLFFAPLRLCARQGSC